MPTWSRRAVLAAGLAGLTAGCTAGEPAEQTTRQQSEDTRPSTGTETDDSTDRADDAALDRREANVVGVDVTNDDTGYSFDVTLHHDDEGEDGYADWWQVERLDGTRLGRRDLRHPHAQQPFTRSDSYDLPADVACVTVRGHDQAVRCSSTCRPAPPARSPRAVTLGVSPRQRVPPDTGVEQPRWLLPVTPPTAGIPGRSRAVAPLSLQ